jgi:hypothetical protein
MRPGTTSISPSHGLAVVSARSQLPAPARREHSSPCACCGKSLRADQVAATTATKLLTVVWCAPCHAGQHWLAFGIPAGEVHRG